MTTHEYGSTYDFNGLPSTTLPALGTPGSTAVLHNASAPATECATSITTLKSGNTSTVSSAWSSLTLRWLPFNMVTLLEWEGSTMPGTLRWAGVLGAGGLEAVERRGST